MEEFIIAIREHSNIGFVPMAYKIKHQELSEFYIIQEAVNISHTKQYANYFSDQEIELVRLIEEYSDANLMRKFARNKKKITNPTEFYKSLDQEFFDNHVRPYVERRVVKIIEILKNSEIRLFHKVDNLSNIYFSDKIIIEKEPAETVFNIFRGKEFTKYYLSIYHKNKDISLYDKAGIILSNEPCRLLMGKKLYYFDDIDGKKLQPFFDKKFIPIPERTEKKWFELFAQPALKKYRVNSSGFEIKDLKPPQMAKLIMQTNMLGIMSFVLKFYYGERSFLPNYKSVDLFYFIEKKTSFYFEKFSHDVEWENECLNKLDRIGLVKTSTGDYSISHQFDSIDLKNYETINWLNENSDNLKKIGFVLEVNNILEDYYIGNFKLDIGLNKTDKDWFDVYAIIKFDEFEIPFIKFKGLILNGIREYKLPNGKVFILPDAWFSKYKDLLLFAEENDEFMKFNSLHFNILDDEIVGVDKNYIKSLKELTNFEIPQQIEIPSQVKADLRTYQKEGYHWMRLLQENNFGGCLADDMGLGKTLQTLSLLSASYQNKNQEKRIKQAQLALFQEETTAEDVKINASLIVMPVSLILNWENEIHKFNPELRLLKHAGSNRDKEITAFHNYDIVLTSYGIIRNDYELLKTYQFHYIILDESQNVKNSNSATYKALLELQSDYKLVLTGTPIENSLTDLWSQMNFVNGGLLGNLNFFVQEYVRPIENQKDEVMAEKLQNLIKPFILRRTKEKVAKDLPPVSEQLIYCDMSDEQADFYEEEKSKIRNAILENIKEDGVSKSSFLALQGLTRLRQIANHPALVHAENEFESGKFEVVKSNLETIVSEGHKVLIFSSFVKHLNLFEQYFLERQWKYSILTGEYTKEKRQKAINHFQNEKDNKLFLISIKAGGVGLNLTSADYVFILDPWWNPAVELQAINRAHRIGQDKNVFVYRFISNNTVEKKIRKLQEEKSALAETFINSNNPFKDFDKDIIMEFFD